MLFGLFLTLGVAVLSVALRSYQAALAQKVGAVGILASTFLAVYFVSGSWLGGLAAALAWFFLPWLEILTRIRALRLPKEKALQIGRASCRERWSGGGGGLRAEEVRRETE